MVDRKLYPTKRNCRPRRQPRADEARVQPGLNLGHRHGRQAKGLAAVGQRQVAKPKRQHQKGYHNGQAEPGPRSAPALRTLWNRRWGNGWIRGGRARGRLILAGRFVLHLAVCAPLPFGAAPLTGKRPEPVLAFIFARRQLEPKSHILT